MADFDTAAKRRSGINLTSPWRAGLLNPSGTVDQAARQTLLFAYAGVAWSAGANNTTGAVLYLRPRLTATQEPQRTTGAVLYVSPRAASGMWQSTGVVPSADTNGLLAWLPHSRQPIAYVEVGGKRYPAYIDAQSWYKFLTLLGERLGGPNGPTLNDIVTAVVNALSQASAQGQQLAAVRQLATTNAEALSVVAEVAVNNSLSGADQIPPIQLSPDVAIQ